MKKPFFLAVCLALVSACKKDSEITPSKTELLTASKWQVTARTSTTTLSTTTGSPPSVITTDTYASMAPCEKDNFLKYSTDKTMVQDEGPTKCYPYSMQQNVYTWAFNSDQTRIFLKDITAASTIPFPSVIVELSATTLRLRETYSSTLGNVTTTTAEEVTYTAF